ncbi:hypothetical protein [Arthrobacter sp. SAFR-014]|uniref:hypothetical protein n=1 Tax=unclassified Arthrobacter TaxID=235627 RepID=UPI003F7CC6DE
MPQLIRESVSLSATPVVKSGRIRIKIIDAGKGSSGDYPASTIEAAVKDKVFAKGLHMYADHPGMTESFDRPERTIKDLAAVLETDAEWVAEESAAYAEAKVFPHWREVISEMADDIGVSIRASAEVEDSKDGLRTITKLLHAESVDFVTKAGRGGKIAEVLESARAVEATANDTREWLQAAVKTTSDGYAYVRDFDDTNVWYASWDDDAEHLYQQGYTLSGNTATLTGDPIEVRVETSYVPITPATEAAKDSAPNPAAVTENQEEANMATIDDKELADLRESASRATAAEADITTATERATRAETALTTANDKAAAAVVEAAFTAAGITAPKTAARLSKGYPVDESGVLNTEALANDIAESLAELQVSNGAGTVRGLGDTVTESKTITDDDVVNAL